MRETLTKNEGVASGIYVKEYLPVEFKGETVECLFYIMNEETKPNILPTAEYFYRIYSGYKEFSLSYEPLFKGLFEAWELRDNTDEYVLYVAYGTNLIIDEMKNRCPKSFPLGKGIIKDYKLVFNCFADIRESMRDSVQVGVWAIHKHDLKNLDYYEGYPSLYNKKNITVNINNTVKEALVYFMVDNKTENPPYASVIERTKQGYKDFNIMVE